jgi:hypothetical protein
MRRSDYLVLLTLVGVVVLSAGSMYMFHIQLLGDAQQSPQMKDLPLKHNEYNNDLPMMPERLLEKYSFENKYKYPSLGVQFYVYDNELNWMNASISGESIEGFDLHRNPHSDDYWLLQVALQHPMCTHEPFKAKLFFVPTLMNVMHELSFMAWRNNMQLQMCVKGICEKLSPHFP